MQQRSHEPHDPSLVGVLRWAFRGHHTGVLKLRRDTAPTQELAFVEGELFLRPAHPLAAEWAPQSSREGGHGSRRRSLEGSLGRRIGRLADEITSRQAATFRFRRQLAERRDGLVGPLPTAQVVMEVAARRCREPNLTAQLGGAGAAIAATPDRTLAPHIELGRDEVSMLARLAEPTSLDRLLADSGDDRRRRIEALCRLWSVDLIQAVSEAAAAEASRQEPEAAPPRPDTAPPTDGDDGDPVLAAHSIWREQFDLTADPFALTPDPAYLFLSEGHAEALAGLKLGLWERRGLMVMTGEVGTGKTTLVYSLLSGLDPKIETAYLSNTLLSFEEMLQSALKDFGAPARSHRRLDLLDGLNSFLRGLAEEGRTAALVIDEAQNLSDEVFEALRLLLNFETYKSKLLQIVLVGQPELSARLRRPALRQIDERVAVRCRLPSLGSREARGYIDHRLGTAGGSAKIFTRPALAYLVHRSAGIPRRINILCHNAMLFAYGRELSRVNLAVVAQAARER